MGLAPLTKVTIISPRSEYKEVTKALAQFEDFHPLQEGAPTFDPGVQELTVKAVRLFAQADQAVKDLGLKLMPGQMDIVFRGAKITRSQFDAADWDDLLSKAEAQLSPLVDEVRVRKEQLQRTIKEETDAGNLRAALSLVSGFTSDLGGLSRLTMLKGVATIVADERLAEFRNAIPEAVILTQTISKGLSLAVVVVEKEDAAKLDKTMKLLELKPLAMPEGYPQNPAEAYRKVSQEQETASRERVRLESELAAIGQKDGTVLLAVRELTDVARQMLDEARISGNMNRLATISGYIPTKQEARFREMFGKWIVHAEPVRAEGEGEAVPTLLVNPPGLGLYQPITKEQGIPGGHEVDPTPLVSFIFPVFFGMMFGDVGHGLILTLFMLLVRHRSTGTMRQWANLFLVAGASSMIFGVVFGEFFELPFSSFVPIPPVVEIIHRAAGSTDSFAFPAPGQGPFVGVYLVMIVAILIGVAHLTTALSLDVYQGFKEHNRTELLLEKVPALSMYLSGVGYGLAFVGAGAHFNMLATNIPANIAPNALLGIPNNVLGAISLAVLFPSMLVLFLGKAVAIAAGKLKGSVGGALFNGGLEVFERILQFLSNTISYVRLAVMLLVHAALLLIVNLLWAPWVNPLYVVFWVIANLLIVAFEGFVVYVQDLRLHLYEFFTKFFQGTGTPFRKILPGRARFDIEWT